MCGITGLWVNNQHLQSEDFAEIVSRIRDTLVHRGPDSSGYWADCPPAPVKNAAISPIPTGSTNISTGRTIGANHPIDDFNHCDFYDIETYRPIRKSRNQNTAL